jgi:tetratricopeptide (TPR) repeat protein
LRYRFHDLVRVYARERASAEDPGSYQAAALARAFSAWLALAEQATRLARDDELALHSAAPRFPLDPAVVQQLLAEPLTWYETERPGIVAAVSQAGQAGLSELCWDIAVTAASMFETFSHYDEWRQTHECALAATRRAADQRGEAAVLAGLAALHITQHRYDQAAATLDPALRFFDRSDDRHGHVLALRSKAFLERISGHPDRALQCYQKARSELAGIASPLTEAALLRSTGSLHLELGQPALAQPYLELSAQITSAAGAGRAHTQVLYRLGEAYLSLGHLDRAEQALTQALDNVRSSIRNVRGEAYALYGLGLVKVRSGLHDEAASLLHQALSIARHVGERLIEARVLLALAELHQGDRDHALALLASAQAICQELRTPLWLAKTIQALKEATQATPG